MRRGEGERKRREIRKRIQRGATDQEVKRRTRKEPRKYAGGMARLYRRKEKLGEEKRNLGAGEVDRGQGMTARKTVTGVIGTGVA